MACPHTGAGGSRAASRCDDQGSSAAAPPPAPASIGDVPIIDAEEEALEHVGRSIAAPPIRTSTHGSSFITKLVPFLGILLIMRVNRILSAVLRGVSHEGRLIGRDACN